ncbi:MAG: pitrilysin family protein, partial [Clostridia bacterium]
SKISDCLKLYSEMFNNFSFVEKEFENEKKIIFEEMKRAEDDNNMILTRRAHQNALGKSLCSHMTLGTEEIVSKIKIKDVISFKKRLYTPQNTVISFCGNISLRMAKSLVQKYFPTLTKGDQKPNFFTESENLLYPNKTFLPIERDIKQTQVRISIKAANTFDEKRYAVSLYACILGGGMSSRLFKRIREELGLVYSISAFSNRSYKYGYLNIGFSTPAKEVEFALKETRKIISDLANNGATEEELQKCKNIFETDFYGEQEKVLSRASTLCKKQMSNHETEDFLKVIKHYKDVTLAQINDIAKQIAAEDVWAITSLGKSKIGELKAFAK